MATSTYGNGSIESAGAGKWRLRVYLGTDGRGKPIRRGKTVRGTKRQAVEALAEFRRESLEELRAPKAARDARAATVAEYAWQYHREHVRDGRARTTALRDAAAFRAIERYFGDTPLAGLTTAEVRAAYAGIREGREMSENALHAMHQKLKAVLRQAVWDDIIPKNPCDPIKVPKPKPKERKALTQPEAARLFSLLSEGPAQSYRIAVLLGLATGMRLGEVMGLMWKNVDLDAGMLFVACQYGSDHEIREPKTERSRRWLSLDEATLAQLGRWKDAQRAELAAINERNMNAIAERGGDAGAYEPLAQTPSTPVVTNELGGFTDINNYSRWFRGFCVDNGFGEYGKVEIVQHKDGTRRYHRTGYTGLKFHELRHTQATLLIGNGADIKTVQQRLGHSSANLTMDIYAHAIRQNDEAAARCIGALLAGEETPANQTVHARAPRRETAEEAWLGFVSDEDKVMGLFGGLPYGTRLSRKEIMERAGLKGEKRAKALMSRLAEEGKLKRSGSTRDTLYEAGGAVAGSEAALAARQADCRKRAGKAEAGPQDAKPAPPLPYTADELRAMLAVAEQYEMRAAL